MSTGSNTLPSLLAEKRAKYGNKKIALREKDYGIWQEISWEDYYEHVKMLSLGLDCLGFKRKDNLAILGDNSPEWIWSYLAAECLGGAPVGIYQDSTPKEVNYILNHSEAKIIVVRDQEQCDKILGMKDTLPHLKKIVYVESKGMTNYDDPLIVKFSEVEELGLKKDELEPDLFTKALTDLSEDDISVIAYTSGTTGLPKGSILTHKNLLSMVKGWTSMQPMHDGYNYVSFIPMAWLGEQITTIYTALYIGFCVNFPEKPETASEAMYEIGPSLLFSPPRFWEGLSRTIINKNSEASFFKRLMFRVCMPIGYDWADLHFKKLRPSLFKRVLYGLAWLCVLRTIKDRHGLSKIEFAYTGGALLGPDVFRFYHAIGIELKQGYGQTEMSGISTMHLSGDVKFDTVGTLLPEAEIKISEEGEILSRGPCQFKGYLKDAEGTKSSLVDGWLRSGDAGYFNDDGHLVVIDRVKDLMAMADGTKFSPVFIENKLKFCPYIVEVCVIGDKREFITALICIDFNHTAKWAEDRVIPYTTYSDLASKKEVIDLIEREVYKVNKTLPKAMKIRRFILLYKELDPDDEELTRTRKLRRGFINEKYGNEIEALYSDKSYVDVETVIKYQDGRSAALKTSLAICAIKQDKEYEAALKKKSWAWWRQK